MTENKKEKRVYQKEKYQRIVLPFKVGKIKNVCKQEFYKTKTFMNDQKGIDQTISQRQRQLMTQQMSNQVQALLLMDLVVGIHQA